MADERLEDVSLQGPSCSDSKHDDGLCFQYEWVVKVCKRSIGNGESAILNVSPAFSTAYNGVQFTWALRLNEDCLAPGCSESKSNGINVFLYYKDGPAQDVTVLEASVKIADSEGRIVFSGLSIAEEEWTRGSGWPLQTVPAEHTKLTEFMRSNVNSIVRISVDIRMCAKAFSPLCYLPHLGRTSRRLEATCRSVLEEVETNAITVPDLDLLLEGGEMFAVHRKVFTFGCTEVENRMRGSCDEKQIKNVFANIYFTEFVLPNVTYFEDLIEVIEGTRSHHIPALTREAERFLCREIIACFGDATFVKKMLLLAEHYQLPVLKMMCAGIIADRIIEHADQLKRIDTITEEMKELAKQINFADDSPSGDEGDSDSLVESVVEELRTLTKRIRKVSISRSCSTTSNKSSRSNSPTTPSSSQSNCAQ